MRMAAPRRADLPGHRRHLATQLFKLVSTVVMGLIGGENRRHHHLLMSRVLLLMFECMFDMSQSTPAHRQTSSGSLTSKLGCAGKPAHSSNHADPESRSNVYLTVFPM